MAPVHDDSDDLERLLLGRSPRFQALRDRSRQSIQAGRGLSEEAFWTAVRKRAKDGKGAPPRPACSTASGNRSEREASD